MRLRVFALVIALGACGNDKMHLHPDGVFVDAPPADPYWMPEPGEAGNWDIQVAAPFDFSTERAMVIVDLWTSVPAATTITYGDSSTVAVPAGAQPTTIATLKARQTVVVCRVGLGGMWTTDPDASKFPEASRLVIDPKMPTEERILDLTDRGPWEDAALARIDLAKEIGCDAIEPYRIDHFGINVDLTLEEQIAWYAKVAEEVHERDLSVGMRNGSEIYDTQAASFDWAIIERCGEDDVCDMVRDVLELRKAVFALDYNTTLTGLAQNPDVMCMRHDEAGIEDGLVKDAALSSAFRQQCP
jgi:hypothetical protein